MQQNYASKQAIWPPGPHSVNQVMLQGRVASRSGLCWSHSAPSAHSWGPHTLKSSSDCFLSASHSSCCYFLAVLLMRTQLSKINGFKLYLYVPRIQNKLQNRNTFPWQKINLADATVPRACLPPPRPHFPSYLRLSLLLHLPALCRLSSGFLLGRLVLSKRSILSAGHQAELNIIIPISTV